jgi:hypothetical protein
MVRKHRSLAPRHNRLNRSGRLRVAKVWIASYPGKNIARGYRKYFGVDPFCAVRELRMLGITIDPAYEAAVLAAGPHARKEKGESKELRLTEEDYWGFAFIAGYTAGGLPYGITKAEMESSASTESGLFDATSVEPLDDDLPFWDRHENSILIALFPEPKEVNSCA